MVQRRRSRSSRSAAATSSRRACGSIRTCGSGCTAAGARCRIAGRVPLNPAKTVSMADSVQRLLVLSPNWLGDAVMALPAIDDLRRHLSDARVIVAARRSVAGLFALVPWVDEIVELEWRGRVADAGAMWSDVRRLRAARPDAALLLPNSFASAWLAFAARVPARWGYARDGRSWLLTRAIALPVAVARSPT